VIREGSAQPPRLISGTLLLLALTALGVVVARGWVSDDAFITLRSVDHFLAGDGLVWNPGERVQVFTHPLWAMLLISFHTVLASGWWAALLLGLSATTAFVVLLTRQTSMGTVAALGLLVGSSSFADFSTSGLENPLIHLLLGALVLWPRARAPRVAGLLAGLALLTRLDVAPLLLPILWGRLKPTDRLVGVRWASGPPLLWLGVSLFWFGALLPNPALAKLGAGVPKAEVLAQGLIYLSSSAKTDPAGAVLLFLGLVACLIRPQLRWVGCGLLAHMAWICWAGGDFMLGRFLTPDLAVAAAALTTVKLSWRTATPLAAAGLLLAALPNGTLRSPLHGVVDEPQELIDQHGLVDERLYYSPGSALIGWEPGVDMPHHPFRERGEVAWTQEVISIVAVGITGYFSAPEVVIIDRTGVTDPFLARLASRSGISRPGHLYREVPFGYREWISSPSCDLRDSAQDALCDDVRLASRGPLLSVARAGAVARLLYGDLTQVLTGQRH